MDSIGATRLEEFLTKKNTSLDAVSKARAAQLKRADSAIQGRMEAMKRAHRAIGESAISVSAIASDTGISRKTFYNNELLREYVSSCAALVDTGKGTRTADCNRLRQKNMILVDQVRKFVLRDIDIENLRHENAELVREVTTLQGRIRSLEKQYERSQKALADVRTKMSSQSCVIVQLPDSTQEK